MHIKKESKFQSQTERKHAAKRERMTYDHIAGASPVLVGGLHYDLRVAVDDLLHRILTEHVDRVELMSYQPLAVEERGDDRPAVFWRDGLVAVDRQ